MEVRLVFGGFYGSVHDSVIIDMVGNYFYEEDYSDKSINWEVIYDRYCQELCEIFGIKLGISLKFEELSSPSSYNYSTAIIILNVNDTDISKVIDLVDLDKIKELAKYYSTSRDGYIPYYSYEELMSDLERNLEFALEILYEDFEYDIIQEISESDFIYHIDFID